MRMTLPVSSASWVPWDKVPVHHAGRVPSLNHSMYQLSRGYVESGMTAYSELQDAEFAAETNGYTAHRHQREVGAGWFDAISVAVKGALLRPRH